MTTHRRHFTARERLETWAHASRMQSDEVTYGLLECVADRAGNSVGRGEHTGADGARGTDVAAVEHAARSRGLEMSRALDVVKLSGEEYDDQRERWNT